MDTTGSALHELTVNGRKDASSTPRSTQSFRFLDLPQEIRNEIYNYTLCTFHRFENPSIDQYSRVHAQALLSHRKFVGTVNILLTNKKVCREGYEYMLKTNLFVRVTCCGFNVRTYLHGHSPVISVLAVDVKLRPSSTDKIGKFPWYAMHLWIGTRRKATGERSLRRTEYMDIMMLWEDLGEFCKRLEIEHAARRQEFTGSGQDPLRFVVQMNPFGPKEASSRQDEGVYTSSFPKCLEERLLQPIKDGVRSFPNLEIKGCNEKALMSEVAAIVSQPRWPSLNTVIIELEKHESDAMRAWQERELLRCAHSCAAGISIASRLQASLVTWHSLQEGDSEMEQVLLQKSFAFHLLFARCLNARISDPPNKLDFPDRNLHIAGTCAAISSMVRHCVPTESPSKARWHPTDHQMAEIAYLNSFAKRGLFERQYSVDSEVRQEVLRDIEAAEHYWPENELFKEEREKVERWIEIVGCFEEWRTQKALAAESNGIEMMILWRKEYDVWDAI